VPDEWHHTVSEVPSGYAYHRAEPAVDWRRDGPVALLTVVFVVLAGQVVGLIWSATTPKLSIRQVALGAESPFESEIAADGRFLLLGLIAGVVCALVVLLLRQHGPGAAIGLAIGGLLAAMVANRVGAVAQHDGTVAALSALGLSHGDRIFDLIGFRVRALGVLLAWPIAAVVVHGLAVALRPHGR